MMCGPDRFVLKLVETAPELKRLYNEHIADNEGLLPHVFMGNVARYAVGAYGEVGVSELKELLDCMEWGLSQDSAETRELVRASFVENLIGEEKAMESLTQFMGPALRNAIRKSIE